MLPSDWLLDSLEGLVDPCPSDPWQAPFHHLLLGLIHTPLLLAGCLPLEDSTNGFSGMLPEPKSMSRCGSTDLRNIDNALSGRLFDY
jgi:hypothetical protein